MAGRFISPFTDFGFKKLFGEEANRILLIDFLNTLIEPASPIRDVNFLKNERRSARRYSCFVIFDMYCTSDDGSRFIVEMQNSFQAFFRDRMVFYSTFPAQEQAVKGYWDFGLLPVYCIGFLGFELAAGEPSVSERVLPPALPYLHKIQLKDECNRVFFGKLIYYIIELPRFKKNEAEILTRFDK